MPNRIHVQRGVQFKADLFKKADRTEWFTEVGKELEKRKLTVTIAPGLQVKNADDLIKLVKRYESDKSGLKTALALPAGTTIENYVSDLVQALDDTVKATSTVAGTFVDFQPASPMGKLLGLDTSSRYSSTSTAFGKMGADVIQVVGDIELVKNPDAKDPLDGQLYMDSKTFANMPTYQWKRDGVELEQVNGVSGVDDAALLKALRSTNGAGRTAYARLRKPEMSEAFTVGYTGVGLDDMRWDADSHKMREKNKFVALTVESGRYDAPAAGQAREISIGTDKMDDTYYDTKDFALMDTDFSVRARARWDTDTEIRRILVQVKSDTTMDEFGNKRNGKVDMRNDGASADEIKNLDRDVRTGISSWNGQSEPFGPMKGLYDAVNKGGKLPEVGGHNDVLQLEPKVHIRSVRSRYHLNETSLSSLQKFYTETTGKLDSVLALATAAQGTATGADKKVVDALVKQGQGIKDGSALLALVSKQLKDLDPKMTVDADALKKLMPSAGGGTAPTDMLGAEKKRVVAEGLDKLYHQFASDLDGARRVITGSQDRTYENHPPLFMAFVKSTDATLLDKKTYDTFLTKFDAMVAKPDAGAADLAAFNAYGAAQKKAGNKDFKEWKDLDLNGFKALRPQLQNEVVRINQRQLEAGGSTALSLYFDEAREVYVPAASRNTGNFIIDTMDMSEYVKDADWQKIAEDKRTPASQLPEDKIFHVSLVNETQIELGEEKPYLARMDELSLSIANDRASLGMKWLDSLGVAGLDATKPETYQATLKTMLGKNGGLDGYNKFVKAQGSALEPVTAKDMARVFTPEFKFTAELRTKDVRKTPDTEKMLEGAKFIFGQIIDVQKGVVAAKEDRVKKVLKDAGVDKFDWKQTDNSKGLTALQMLRKNPA